MKTEDIRKLFLDYFASKNHQLVKSSDIVPKNDDTLLFTNSGMVQFKDVFLNTDVRDYKRAVSCQKCLRAGGKHNDLDNVGYTARHHTFFEMLGNFSFGDYFKEEAILYAWDFITKQLQLPTDKLLITVYDKDQQSFDLWKKLTNFHDDKIIRISTNDNFWEMGNVGPCGPCSEIFYDYGETIQGGKPGTADQDGDRFVEFWNLVFMQYQKMDDGSLNNLTNPSIDTGMGLERIASIMQGKHDNYDIDIFQDIMRHQEDLFSTKMDLGNRASFKIIADHLRSTSFMISEGILPSNEGRGYVLRRILRRATRYAYMMGSKNPSIYKLVDTLVSSMPYYSELEQRKEFIKETIRKEEQKFLETCGKGIQILDEEISKINGKKLSGSIAFKLYDTYGFPFDLTKDILHAKNLEVSEDEFNKAFENHKNLAKDSWKGNLEIKDVDFWNNLKNNIKNDTDFIGYDNYEAQTEILALILIKDQELSLVSDLKHNQKGYAIFKSTPFYAEMGGQAGDQGYIFHGEFIVADVIDTTKMHGLYLHKLDHIKHTISVNQSLELRVNKSRRDHITKLHSAVHLLHEAAVKVLGTHVSQQGSMITENRLRFDISHDNMISANELKEIEDLVNHAIIGKYPVTVEYMELEKAIKLGAVATFGEKYPKIARTVKIGNKDDELYSFELCGGTHVSNSSEIGLFKIISEGSKASGVRRIEAICSTDIITHLNEKSDKIQNIITLVNSNYNAFEEKISSVIDENKNLKRSLKNLSNKYYSLEIKSLFQNKNGLNYIISEANNDIDLKDMREVIINLNNQKSNSIIILYKKISDTKASFMMGISANLKDILNLKHDKEKIIKAINASFGGNETFIQGTANFNKFTNLLDYFN